MAHKHLLVQSAARDNVLHGATALADAVSVTLSPRSKWVLLETKGTETTVEVVEGMRMSEAREPAGVA
jgi:chaperonin GroEL